LFFTIPFEGDLISNSGDNAATGAPKDKRGQRRQTNSELRKKATQQRGGIAVMRIRTVGVRSMPERALPLAA
jgi:hypothetical protein